MFLSLGTNLGDRAANLRAAVRALRDVVAVDALSAVYESDAVGFTAQPRFWNMVVRARTALSARDLLDAVKRLELELGREPTFRMGPRLIDIDVLLYDDARVDEPGLQIPHPRMHERAFVLRPLLDIDDAIVLPHVGSSAAQQLASLDASTLIRVGDAAEVLDAS